jgi:hypothetical protein
MIRTYQRVSFFWEGFRLALQEKDPPRLLTLEGCQCATPNGYEGGICHRCSGAIPDPLERRHNEIMLRIALADREPAEE